MNYRKHTDIDSNIPQVISELLSPSINEALVEIENRRKNNKLIKKVEEYLQNDIPKHFIKSKPILYLSRHLATPNYEVLHVLEITKGYNYELVIGEDTKAIFVSNNELKFSLAKLPIVTGLSKTGNDIIENRTIIDFTTSQGKPMDQISTSSGKSLPNFHQELFKSIYPKSPEVVDESEWIDRNNRHNILEQYKRMMALLCVHGVMLESYVPKELEFVTEIINPAFKAIQQDIGVSPLIVEHIPPTLETTRNWNSYPPNVSPFIDKHLSV